MADYFDPTDASDKLMLPEAIRAADDIANVSAEAEAEVIAAFTDTSPSASSLDCVQLLDADGDGIGRYVCLKGYTTDSADAEQNLTAAMKREIAGLIKWRYQQWNREPGLAMDVSGSKTRAMKGGSDNTFPPGFGRWLRPYDTRHPLDML